MSIQRTFWRVPSLWAVMVVAGAVWAGTPADAQAQATEKQRQIAQILRVSGEVPAPSALAAQLMAPFSQKLEASNVTVTVGMRETMVVTTNDIVRRHYGKLVGRVINLYDRAFNDEEIAALSAFWHSPVGHKMTAIRSKLDDREQLLIDQWTTNLQNEIQTELVKALKPHMR